MTRLSRTFEPFDVVVVPFPFTDQPRSKRRPALVLSSREFNARAGHSVAAMITSGGRSSWPLDTPIRELSAAGLHAPCVVRMKLFTLDNRLILRRSGSLGLADREQVEQALRKLIRWH